MRKAIQLRKTKVPGKVLTSLSDCWSDVILKYDEEIGLQYPFIDPYHLIEEITKTVSVLSSNTPRQPHKTRTSSTAIDVESTQRLEDTAVLILAIVASLADTEITQLANPLVEEIYGSMLIKSQLDAAVNKECLTILILTVRIPCQTPTIHQLLARNIS